LSRTFRSHWRRAAFAATKVDAVAAWSSSWLLFTGAPNRDPQMLDGGADAAIIGDRLVVSARCLLAHFAPHAQGWPRRGAGSARTSWPTLSTPRDRGFTPA
jgi:hypothetical protein